MVGKADRGDLAADQNPGIGSSSASNRADATLSYTDKGLQDHFDVDGYAMMVHQANIKLGLSDAQNEYNTAPGLRDLLAQASAASTVSRRRARRT
ncbi:hypothetical protein CQY20_22055 [Mycolicibacterium agri]|uniref:Uncharacterized protein n=1 Tax=Mycolicibacterium agri TaxID=36811 RepID=A0A2A7MUX6_MYCAG|nr:hypothetical protein [Mycolicibacterium agri]PEG35360.1 hypothetical protein CQY20_22055 [Mycolicibacterium agri]GFG53492.1 hypothetical protein MAGR_49330 [Mycolicibacterium agri]